MVPPRKPKIICPCLHVDEDDILEALASRQITSIQDIIEFTSAGDGCTACHPALLEYLERQRRSKKQP